MDTELLIERHQKAIELLEAIDYFDRRKTNINHNMGNLSDKFPSLVNKYKRDYEIMEMSKQRLIDRYNKLYFAKTQF